MTVTGEIIPYEDRRVDAKTGEIIPYEPPVVNALFGTLEPEKAVAEGGRYAKALAKVIDQQRMFAKIGANKHITVEGWQTLGAMTGVYAVGEGEPAPVEIDGVFGFKATVVAVRNGEVIGRATAYCMRDEERWKSQPTYAVASMAQTRATSKALKGPLGFIVKLAGYSATPAEEMPERGGAIPEPRPGARVPIKDGEEALASGAQVKNIWRLIAKLDAEGAVTKDAVLEAMGKEYGTEAPAELFKSQASDLITRLKAKAGEE